MTGLDRIGTVALSGVVLTGLVVHRRIDDLLSAMHPPGSPAHGIGDLVPLTRTPSVADAGAVLNGWLADVVSQPGFPGGREVAHRALGLDFVLAVAVPLLLWLLLTHVRAHLTATGATVQPAASYIDMVDAARWGLIGLAAADLFENVGLWLTVDHGAHGWILWGTWLLSIAKWGLVFGCGLPLVIAGAWLVMRRAARPDAEDTRRCPGPSRSRCSLRRPAFWPDTRPPGRGCDPALGRRVGRRGRGRGRDADLRGSALAHLQVAGTPGADVQSC